MLIATVLCIGHAARPVTLWKTCQAKLLEAFWKIRSEGHREVLLVRTLSEHTQQVSEVRFSDLARSSICGRIPDPNAPCRQTEYGYGLPLATSP